jgi:hypothetical protein
MKRDRHTTPTTKTHNRNPKTLQLNRSSKNRNGLNQEPETVDGIWRLQSLGREQPEISM